MKMLEWNYKRFFICKGKYEDEKKKYHLWKKSVYGKSSVYEMSQWNVFIYEISEL